MNSSVKEGPPHTEPHNFLSCFPSISCHPCHFPNLTENDGRKREATGNEGVQANFHSPVSCIFFLNILLFVSQLWATGTRFTILIFLCDNDDITLGILVQGEMFQTQCSNISCSHGYRYQQFDFHLTSTVGWRIRYRYHALNKKGVTIIKTINHSLQ